MADYSHMQDSTVSDTAAKADSTGGPVKSELEMLGDELSRRDMRTTLGPDNGGQVLEVINPRMMNVSVTRTGTQIWHKAGRFWWHGGEEIGLDHDIARTADRVTAELGWSRAVSLPAPGT